MSTNHTEQPLIQVKHLDKSFGSLKVLKDVTVDIYKGDVVCVIGASGSGKSTFLRCLNRLEELTGGQIFFEGVDITDAKTDINKHRQKMGMVFQQFNLFPHMTIMDNLTLAPLSFRERRRKRLSRSHEASGESRPGRSGKQLSQPAVRRTEAENRHCPPLCA